MASPKKKWLRRKAAAEAAAAKSAPKVEKVAPAPKPVKVEEKVKKKPARRLRLSKDRE